MEENTCLHCEGGIEKYDGDDNWYHSRIEDFSHTPEPKY